MSPANESGVEMDFSKDCDSEIEPVLYKIGIKQLKYISNVRSICLNLIKGQTENC